MGVIFSLFTPGAPLLSVATLSNQISRQYGYMLFGQSMRHELYRAWHMTVSNTMQGFFISTIRAVFSSISLLTRFSTRYVPPQYGTNSASQYIPRFRLLRSTV